MYFLLIGLFILCLAVTCLFFFKKLNNKNLEIHDKDLSLQQQSEELLKIKNILEEKEKLLESYKDEIKKTELEIVKLNTENEFLKTEIKKSEENEVNNLAKFQNIATTILEEKTKKFTEQNQINLTNILKPLADNIQMFEQQIKDSHKQSNDQAVALRLELAKLYALNTKITQEAENLANAIKGDSKVQGNWGEMILEKILESSGLSRDREYIIQNSMLTDEGKRYQPDVIVNLPMGRHIIIDSKVSLKNYEQFFNSNEDDIKIDQLKKHLSSIKKHISSLSEKKYQTLYSIGSLDFVLMFIPIEQAYTLIVQNDQNIFSEAYENNIILVSPSTLIATLRTISNIWRNEYQNKNALEIAHQSGALYDKFVGFIEDIKQIGKMIDGTKTSYIDAVKKLYEGKGNLISRVEKIKGLGVKTTKSLDSKLVSIAQDNDE